jgi:uncharacterized Zn finger protein (UPF0148 family)
MDKEIKVSLPTDENGMTGRECPECSSYFKIKGGTGLPTDNCLCPYCGYKANYSEFTTKEQIDYATSIALNKTIGPEIQELKRSIDSLEHTTRGGLIQIKGKLQGFPFRTKYYKEKELETSVKCDSCGLEFSIYGVFANCPDCGRLNALVVFIKSIETAQKRLNLLKLKDIADENMKQSILKDALSEGVSSFDAFGKALRLKYPDIFPKKPKNLFQNLRVLSEILLKYCKKSIRDILGDINYELLDKVFQVRHIYEHNMGVIDDEFVHKLPALSRMLGRKYSLDENEINKFLKILVETGSCISKEIE